MDSAGAIRVFEHQRIRWKDAGLGKDHVRRLIAWNEANGGHYLGVGLGSFTFTQYVGVIQVGDRVIEVLPKADRREDDGEQAKNKWQRALLTMLHEVHELPLTSTTATNLHKRTNSILDFFFELFVSDVEELVHQGLVKRYRRTKGNQTALKGRLDFPRHLQHNLIHKERFFVEHQVYDTDHVLHSLLKRALEIVGQLSRADGVGKRAQGLDWAFEQVTDRTLTPQVLDRITLDRKTAPYARAVQLAKMIVVNHAPDLKGGSMPLIGLMFDMNRLFEEFVFRILRKASRSAAYKEMGLNVRNQRSMRFWNRKTIRPDIVVEYTKAEQRARVIVDTKWKVPPNGKPNDADLKQMFVYNLQFDASESVLLYPASAGSSAVAGSYAASARLSGWSHQCRMQYATLFNGHGMLLKDAATTLLGQVL